MASAQAGAYEDFFKAVGSDDVATVSTLLQRGFDPNSRDGKGQLPLYLSLREFAPKVAEALLATPGLQLDATNAAGETALMMAALRGRTEWVRRLIERGAQIERSGWTPLHYAASSAEGEGAARLLLERGAKIDALSPNGSTPLMMAARYGSEATLRLLIERGADLKLQNQLGLDAAGFARAAGREALASWLQKAGR